MNISNGIDYSELINLFKDDDKLFYHYTSLESACKIVCSGKILLKKLSQMNDIDESCKSLYAEKWSPSLGDELMQIKQASLAMDDKKDKTKGFTIAPMWGHYAEKGKGVCVVLKRDAILKEINRNKSKYYGKKIIYKKDYDSSIILDTNKNIWDNRRNIFFKKDKHWNYEKEYKIISNEETPYLIIKDALSALIISGRYSYREEKQENYCDWITYDILSRISPDVPILIYNHFLGEKGLTDGKGNTIWSSVNWENIQIGL